MSQNVAFCIYLLSKITLDYPFAYGGMPINRAFPTILASDPFGVTKDCGEMLLFRGVCLCGILLMGKHVYYFFGSKTGSLAMRLAG